jgi:hypothetical protein
MAKQVQTGSTAAGGGVTPNTLAAPEPASAGSSLSLLDPLFRRVRFQRLYLRLFDLSEAAHDPARAARLLLLSLVAYRHSVGGCL